MPTYQFMAERVQTGEKIENEIVAEDEQSAVDYIQDAGLRCLWLNQKDSISTTKRGGFRAYLAATFALILMGIAYPVSSFVTAVIIRPTGDGLVYFYFTLALAIRLVGLRITVYVLCKCKLGPRIIAWMAVISFLLHLPYNVLGLFGGTSS